MKNKEVYRPNVAMIIVSPNYPEKKEIFIAQRNDLTDIWQFPQGGIDEGEEVKEALFRELEEEIGTNDVTILHEYPKWISYDFPPKIANKMKPFVGQKQKYFLVKLSENAKINIQTKHPEFNAYKFVKVEDVLKQSASFKQVVYETVIDYFKKEEYL
jgi:putative (di)nucleoside polyphosphate hydrolase